MNPSDPSRIEIPIRHCPTCRTRPMIVQALVPQARSRSGTEVTYQCTQCATTQVEIIKPAD